MSAADDNAKMGSAPISKNLHGAHYGNPYQAPYVENDYTQNVPPPKVSGGGPPYVNPVSAIDEFFFDPATPNDPAFSDMQAPNEISTADPIGQIKADFGAAIQSMPRQGRK